MKKNKKHQRHVCILVLVWIYWWMWHCNIVYPIDFIFDSRYGHAFLFEKDVNIWAHLYKCFYFFEFGQFFVFSAKLNVRFSSVNCSSVHLCRPPEPLFFFPGKTEWSWYSIEYVTFQALGIKKGQNGQFLKFLIYDQK